MIIANYMTSSDVVLDVTEGPPHAVFRQLLAPLRRENALIQVESIVDDLAAREEMMSTALGQGYAIPHTHTAQIASPRIIIGRSLKGIDFKAIDCEPVHCFFLILYPKDAGETHMILLSRLSQLMMNTPLMERILMARDSENMIKTIAHCEKSLSAKPGTPAGTSDTAGK